eukprot:IDg23436t1
MHAKAIPGIFLGCDDHGVYIIEQLKNGKRINSVHVTFHEDEFPALDHSDFGSSNGSDSEIQPPHFDETTSSGTESQVSIKLTDEPTSSHGDEDVQPNIPTDKEKSSKKRYPLRSRTAPDRYGCTVGAKIIKFPITTSDTLSVTEAMSATSPERDAWIQAIKEELNSLEQKGTWTKVSREVAKREDKIADGVYAPVVDYSIVLLTLAISKHLSWKAAHLDVKTAFLNGDIDREHIDFLKHSKDLKKNFTGEKQTRKSRTGFVGYINECPFIWRSYKQKSTAKSTAESEYIAMSECASEISRIRLFLAELGFIMDYPVPLYSDNTAAQCWAKDIKAFARLNI